ncbi:ThuA domain-containing protein [Chitinophaga horti]|uniref:ThuA domain-containing protein n=1 Tax=Chitinophaga horti TaxID=2920382 RepID=A0ABY6IV87_9BACT|nr:ThuA domain-containing protein [Chitinophaga horti]UYQ91287.1 ThuA domain-containing protein [Chitinophaga horti]
MKLFWTILAAILLTAFVPPKKERFSWKGVRVLVYTKNGKGYVHNNIAAGTAALRQLARDNGFGIDVTDDPAYFTNERLKQYQVLIFHNTNNDVFDNDTQKLALMHYVQAGGGVVGVHSATGTERNWPWFKRMMGGSFVRHPPYQRYKQIVIDSTHPSTSFLPKVWEQQTECYYVKEINPDLHVLMVNDLNSVQDKDRDSYAGGRFYGNSFPAVWCHEFDGGRQWYTSFGHDSTTYKDPLFLKHVLGGIQWAAGNKRLPDYRKARAISPNDPLPY